MLQLKLLSIPLRHSYMFFFVIEFVAARFSKIRGLRARVVLEIWECFLMERVLDGVGMTWQKQYRFVGTASGESNFFENEIVTSSRRPPYRRKFNQFERGWVITLYFQFFEEVAPSTRVWNKIKKNSVKDTRGTFQDKESALGNYIQQIECT